MVHSGLKLGCAVGAIEDMADARGLPMAAGEKAGLYGDYPAPLRKLPMQTRVGSGHIH